MNKQFKGNNIIVWSPHPRILFESCYSKAPTQYPTLPQTHHLSKLCHEMACISTLRRFVTYPLWRWGVTCLFKDVPHETPNVAPCRTSPPMPVFRTWYLARTAWCNTMSHLTAAGCRDWRGLSGVAHCILAESKLTVGTYNFSSSPPLGFTAVEPTHCGYKRASSERENKPRIQADYAEQTLRDPGASSARGAARANKANQ